MTDRQARNIIKAVGRYIRETLAYYELYVQQACEFGEIGALKRRVTEANMYEECMRLALAPYSDLVEIDGYIDAELSKSIRSKLDHAFRRERENRPPPAPEPPTGSLANALARRSERRRETIAIMTEDMKAMGTYKKGWYVYVELYDVDPDQTRRTGKQVWNCSIKVPMTDSEVAEQVAKGSTLRSKLWIVAVPAKYVEVTNL